MSVTPKRRQHGTGSVYRRASDGIWCGSFDAGYTRTGGRRRPIVTGKTEAEVRTKLKLRIREFNQGSDVATRTTVKAWAATWLAERQQVDTPNAHTTDRAAVGWIVETIGARRLDQLTPGHVR